MNPSFTLVTGPAAEPISLDEAKAFLRITTPALSSGYAQATAGANNIPLSNGSADNVKLAATFVQSGQASVKTVTLQLRKIGTLATGKKLTLALKADAAGAPGVTLGTAGTVDIDTLVATSYGAVEFVFSTAVDLANATRYHIELTADYTASASNQVQWRALTVASAGNTLIFDAAWAPTATLSFEVSVSQYEAAGDDLISAFISAARQVVEDFTGRALMPQSWKYTARRWPGWPAIHDRDYDDWHVIELRPSPLIAVQSVKYYPADGTAQATLADTKYVVAAFMTPGEVVLNADESWPDLYDRPDAAEVNFTAGYATAAAIPPVLVQCVKLLVKHFYDVRDSVDIGGIVKVNEVPMTVRDLMQSQRVGGFIG